MGSFVNIYVKYCPIYQYLEMMTANLLVLLSLYLYWLAQIYFLKKSVVQLKIEKYRYCVFNSYPNICVIRMFFY